MILLGIPSVSFVFVFLFLLNPFLRAAFVHSFVIVLTLANLSCSIIEVCSPGVQFHIRCYDPSFPSIFSNQAVKLLLKGISKSHPSPPDPRQPITLGILHAMVLVLRAGVVSPYVDSLLESMFLLAFYACLSQMRRIYYPF